MHFNFRHHFGWWLIFVLLKSPIFMKNTASEFSIIKRFQSFKCAFNGLKILVREEHNFRIHVAITVIILTFSFILKIEKIEWFAILFSIAIVFVVEILNTSIENLSDFVSPQYNHQIKRIKDLSATAVFICSFVALLIGSIIFIPKIF